jgi:hypothetical protein
LFSAQRWLSLQVAPDPEIARRIPLLATAYTFRAIKADTAQYALTAPQQAIADSARIAGTIPVNSVDSTKLSANSVTNTKLAPGFKAPNAVKADTAQYALTAPQQGFADSARIAGTIPNATITNPKLGPDAVTTDKILTNTILRADVAENFKAPYADTADYVKNVPIADSARIAGTIPGNSIDSTKLASNSVTNSKLATGFKAPDAVIADSARNAWSLSGNAGTDPSTNFIGTTDNRDFIIKQNGQKRIRVEPGGLVSIGLPDGQDATGILDVLGHEATQGDNIILTAGRGTSQRGGNASVNGGIGTLSADGGEGRIGGGIAQGSGNGGLVTVAGGNAEGIGSGNGGGATVTGGNVTIGNGTGGRVAVHAGDSPGIGGTVSVSGGKASGTGPGGDVLLTSGESSSGNPGNLVLKSSNAQIFPGKGGGFTWTGGDSPDTAGSMVLTAGTGQRKGGDIIMKSGVAQGVGVAGNFEFTAGNSGFGLPGGFLFRVGPSNTPARRGRFEIVGAASESRLTIDSIGNVGIGTPTPTEKLEVAGNVKIGNATIRSGTGIPEGAVTGKVGDLFLRTDGGSGSTMYVKESGNGTNTGWAAK